MGERMHGERDRRRALAARALDYPIALFADFFEALLPHDLFLLGAGTGLGKTQLALSMAAAVARKDLRAHYFALEAERDELERRTKYSLICDELFRTGHPRAGEMRYVSWYLGRCDDICGHLEAWADRRIEAELSTLYTFYRGRDFAAEQLARMVIEHADETDLFVLDHLHYVDDDGAEDENRSVTDLIKTVRDLGLVVGKPFVLVAHLRKKDERAHKLVPELGDFHGSSNITKVCTQVVTLERAWDVEPAKWWLSPTYAAIKKDRREGAPPFVALMTYDLRTRTYRDEYTLGRAKGRKWTELAMGDVPRWAITHRPLVKGETSQQEPLPIRPSPPTDDIPHASTDPRYTP